MRKLLVVLAMVGVLALLLPIPAQAGSGIQFYVNITGEKQGKIDGSCDKKGREKTIEGWRLQHDIHIPRDPQSGLASGKRIHGPLSITKDFDKSTPKLYQALCTGEHMKEVIMKFYRRDPKGAEEHYFTITLQDAIIVSVQPYVNVLDSNALNRGHDLEDIGFTYKKIKWSWEIDGIQSEDSWVVPR